MASVAQLPDNVLMNSNCSVIRSAQSVYISSNISAGNSQATFILSWQNVTSSLDLVVNDPSGLEIDPTAKPPIMYQKDNLSVQYLIPDPLPGDWTAKVVASATPEPGEGYCLLTLLTLAESQVLRNESDDVTEPMPEGCPTCSQSG
jgi:hypothetical protein